VYTTRPLVVPSLLLVPLFLFLASLPGLAPSTSTQAQPAPYLTLLSLPASVSAVDLPVANAGQTPVCGAWSVYAAPNPNTTGYLFDVSAVSATDVWAAGTRRVSGQNGQTLTQHWDGIQWSEVPSPNIAGAETSLYSVEAVSPTQVWAAGNWSNPSFFTGGMFMVRWDGAQWATVPGLPLANTGRLFGLGSSSPSNVWSVGDYRDNTGRLLPLTIHWDGATWSSIPSVSSVSSVSAPNAPLYDYDLAHLARPSNKPLGYSFDSRAGGPTSLRDKGGAVQWEGDIQLFGVEAISETEAWAVGYSIIGGVRRVLTIHWDGSQWTTVPNPATGYLWGLSALSANDVWATGVTGSYPVYRLLVMHWDGVAWSVAPTPDVVLGSYEWQQADISAVASDDVWAVSAQQSDQALQAVITHWDGVAWTVDPGPGPQPGGSQLSAVESIGGGNIWSAGFGPTIYHYANPCLTPTATPSPPPHLRRHLAYRQQLLQMSPSCW
jgi:hypothetical protein